MTLFQRLSFKSKLMVLILSMVIFIGGTMGVLVRIVVFPYVVKEVENRGRNTAQRLAENARGYILQRDRVHLTTVIFEERAIDKNIAYIVVTDEKEAILAHTFLGSVPSDALFSDNSGDSKPHNEAWWLLLPNPRDRAG